MKLGNLSLALLSLFPAIVVAQYKCNGQQPVYEKATVDYLFLIDLSPSMNPYIAGVKLGLSKFASMVSTYNSEARFGIVHFGGVPRIRMPFTFDFDEFQCKMDELWDTQGQSQEASMEAIRGSLPPYNGRLFVKNCTVSEQICNIEWRQDALKAIILVTDEDSDIPLLDEFKMPGQNASSSLLCYGGFNSDGSCVYPQANYEPGFTPRSLASSPAFGVYQYFRSGNPLRLSDAFEAEIEATARSLLDNHVFLNALISSRIGTDLTPFYPVSTFCSSSTYWKNIYGSTANSPQDDSTVSYYQFGHPLAASQSSDFKQFNSVLTLEALRSRGLGNSLQARVLGGRGTMRVFDVVDMVRGDQTIIEEFFSQLVEITYLVRSDNCEVVPINYVPSLVLPSPPASTLSSGVSGASGTGINTQVTGVSGTVGSSTGEPSSSSQSSDSLVVSQQSTTGPAGGNDRTKPTDDNGTPLPTPGIIGAAAGVLGLVIAAVVYKATVVPTPAALSAAGVGGGGSVSENPLYTSTDPIANPLYE